ncbi:MAG TPA: DUF6172 family protein [Opitutaceae bacterium]|nr:DUF6172 family protein [Opitutaceae bacterium]
MKKSFPLHVTGKADARVLDAIKHDVRKYVQRERRKTLPEGFDLWNFDCKVGPEPAGATPCALGDISGAVDAVALGGAPAVYIEILASPGHRNATPMDSSAGPARGP